MLIETHSGFSKRHNSTKQPSTAGTQVNVLLKDGADDKAPVFEINTLDFNINYVKAFGNYYFAHVQNIDGHRSNVICDMDYLATYKSYIAAYTCSVVRSSGAYNDKIFDPMVLPTGEIVQSAITAGDLLNAWDDTGSYVVTTVGQNGLRLYILTLAQVKALFNTFFDTDFSNYLVPGNVPASVEKAVQALFVANCNPSQYVKRVLWFPFSMAGGTSEIPYFGFVGANAAVPISVNGLNTNASITKPARYYNDYRDFDSRFTSANIYLPGYGCISLDPKYLEKDLSVWYSVDAATGACQIQLLADVTNVATVSCQIGCDVNVGGVTGSNVLAGVGNAIMNGASGNFGGTVGGLGDAIHDRLSPPHTSIGASGNRFSLLDRSFIQVDVTRLGSTAYPTATSGRSTYKNLTLGNLTGYIQCQNASIEIPGDGAEQDAVNGYLNSGFYFE